MTNALALVLTVMILIAVGVDLTVNDGVALTFLARKFLDLLEWVVFWR
jgi:hypothetical protein